jgi:xeroderma pigmentosum group C-complementing protein
MSKREHSPEDSLPAKRQAIRKLTAKRDKAKPTLFEAADTPLQKRQSAADTKNFLESLDDDGDGESLSEIDSDEFEDVHDPSTAKQGTKKLEDDGDDEEMDWEDAIHENTNTQTQTEPEIGDIDVSLNEDGVYVEPLISLATGMKGPSKRERRVRILTHQLHVQSLMWHNTVRNSWLNDKQVQDTLVSALTEGVKREVARWREAMGFLSKEELQAKKEVAAKAMGVKGGKGMERPRGETGVTMPSISSKACRT